MLDFPTSPKLQVCYGLLACLMSHTSTVWTYISPILTAVATITGAFVALHGAYMILKDWRNKNGH